MRKYKEIPLDQLVEPLNSLRTQVTKEGLEELAVSIRHLGVIEPLIVREIDRGKYEIVAGWRRYTAAKMAKLITAPCMVISSGDPKELIKFHENLYRENMSDPDQGKYFVWLRDDKGLKLPQVATAVGKSLSYVIQRVQLLQGDERVLAAVEGKQITFSVARELAAIKDEGLRERLLGMAVDQGASPRTVHIWKKSLEKILPPSPGPVAPEEIDTVIHNIQYPQEKCYICKELHRTDTLVPIRICERCSDVVLSQERPREVKSNDQ